MSAIPKKYYSPLPSNGNDQDDQKENIEDYYHLLTTTLPCQPGYDVFSKEILRADETKDIVIKSLFKESLAPVIVEVQKRIDKDFIGRVIRYSLNVFDATGSYPHLVVISNAGFSSKRYRDTTFNKEENEPYYTHPCQSWANSTRFYTPESIAIHMDKEPLDKMIALCHVFFMQEKNIMLLKKTIYKVALEICSIDTDKVAKLFADTQSFCDTVECQFQKILNENDRKRQLKYAKDAIHFCTPIQTYMPTING
ncbi:hypothetical protein CLU79DRAFT_850543 [Phycomyces nitens]|nr:hypothetical protein CLU79DRAFT_850543 [Phycomyces nitens]